MVRSLQLTVSRSLGLAATVGSVHLIYNYCQVNVLLILSQIVKKKVDRVALVRYA